MSETGRGWTTAGGAIVERPREIRKHPLLARIYDRHDGLIARHVRGRTLEVAFGTHPHPLADVGVEAYPENSRRASGIAAVTADARALPFADGAFETVIGRRFLHHVPELDRGDVLGEAARVLAPGGKLVLLEGTPGLYRRITKGIAFRLGFLGEDNDAYGHLDRDELATVVRASGFETVETRSLGSPVMPFSIATGRWTRRLFGLYERTQFVRWWTLVVAERPDRLKERQLT